MQVNGFLPCEPAEKRVDFFFWTWYNPKKYNRNVYNQSFRGYHALEKSI